MQSSDYDILSSQKKFTEMGKLCTLLTQQPDTDVAQQSCDVSKPQTV